MDVLPFTPPTAPAVDGEVFTVTTLSLSLKRMIEGTYGAVRVRGEVSGAKRHTSGHLYFSLKDADSVLDSVCWRGVVSRLPVALEDGLEIICTGRVTTYASRSKYQLVVENVTVAGEGALLKLLEDRRRRLQLEGLFDPARKRPLPFLPQVIGVVTSPTGAVLRDILHRLGDRFPSHVLVWPVLVQGEGAAAQIAAAIRGFGALKAQGPVPRPDVLIVARGGGSLEDLWAFNEEIVVRAAADSSIPLISAVGHETDTTLIDYAADLRMPTPTAAAEKAVPVRQHLWDQIQEFGMRLSASTQKTLHHGQIVLQGLQRALPSLTWLVTEKAQRLDDLCDRLHLTMPQHLQRLQQRLQVRSAALRDPSLVLQGLEQRVQGLGPRLLQAVKALWVLRAQQLRGQSQMLSSLSPQQVLERGYVMVCDPQGQPLSRLAQARGWTKVTLRFYDGETKAALEEVRE